MSRRAVAVWCAWALWACVGMGCERARGGAEPVLANEVPAEPTAKPLPPPPPEVLALYDAAAERDELHLVALAAAEGVTGLTQEAERTPSRRPVVVAALPWTRQLGALSYLAAVADGGAEEEALQALAAGQQLSNDYNRNEQLEDRAEVWLACQRLGRVVERGAQSKAVRAAALTLLRSLQDVGCQAPESSELDSK